MKIAVFGATGGTGRELTRQATAAGHRICALTRSPEKLLSTDGVTAIEGDVLNREPVATTLDGTDAAVCLLGLVLDIWIYYLNNETIYIIR